MNVCWDLLGIVWNYLMIFEVFFYRFVFVILIIFLFMLFKICLLIILIFDFVGFMSLYVGLFMKLGLWFFNVMNVFLFVEIFMWLLSLRFLVIFLLMVVIEFGMFLFVFL